MKKVLILDDQPVTLQHLTNLVGELNIKCEVLPFHNVKDAYQCALERKIDLFIIDIILDNSYPGDTSGLKFVENVRRVEGYAFTPVIFVTSLEDMKSYTYEKLHCFSYIEKPFDAKKVKQTMEHCLAFPGKENGTKTLYFRKEGVILAVDLEDIVYVQSSRHIMHIYTRQGDEMEIPYVTIKKIQADMDSSDMLQCSRSTIVNTRFIQNVDIANGIIRLKSNFGQVNIGVMFKKYVKELLG